MKNYVASVLLIFSANFVIADGHSADEVDAPNSKSNGYILMSTYEMAYGSKFKDLEKSLIEETKAGVKDGYDACSLYRHIQVLKELFI